MSKPGSIYLPVTPPFEATVHYTHHSGWALSHRVDNRIDLKALIDVLLDNGYTELIIHTHEHEEESA